MKQSTAINVFIFFSIAVIFLYALTCIKIVCTCSVI